MSYVKVAVGLPLESTFDYLVPDEFRGKILPGARLKVNFGGRKITAYAVELSESTGIKNIKPVLKVCDTYPVLDSLALELTKRLSQYYCCSWGQAIEAALPPELRSGRDVPPPQDLSCREKPANAGVVIIRAADASLKWSKYLDLISSALADKTSVIYLAAGAASAARAAEAIRNSIGIEPVNLAQKAGTNLKSWLAARDGRVNVIVGARSSVFAPVRDLGLIIVDEEQDTVYKQEQAPHYHARQVSLMRGQLEGAKVVLGSFSPSLESFYLAKTSGAQYLDLPPQRSYPEVKVLDPRPFFSGKTKARPLFSKYLQDCVYSALESKKQVLLFLNRRGFSTYAACNNCGAALKCPRCNISLVLDANKNILSCRHCNFKMAPAKICPSCNAGYIKYSGAGTQKIETTLKAIFPAARVMSIDGVPSFDRQAADIYVSTSAVFREQDAAFDLTGVLMIDNTLNRVDLRSGEKVYSLLANLVRLTKERLVIETGFASHHAIKAIEKADAELFYEEELKHRKQLGFPPVRHMIILRVRGRNIDKVSRAAEDMFRLLSKGRKKGVKILSVNPGLPPKLRDNYYWQVLISAADPVVANTFLKNRLKTFRRSGIIVTVDVDPV